MNTFRLLTEHSPWFILLCAAIGALYAFFLYQKKHSWSLTVNRLLSATRFTLVFLICLLLLGILLKHFKNENEKPSIVFALDNSSSISFMEDSNKLKQLKSELEQLNQELQKEDISTEIILLNNESRKDLSTSPFNFPYTNLSSLLNTISNNYENRNLAGVVLISDGIFNQGTDPSYRQYKFPVYSIGMGDTVPKQDLQLRHLYYNKLSYKGNRFPIVAEVYNNGFKGKSTKVVLKQGSVIVESKIISFRNEEGIQEVEFYHSAETKGMQHYVIEVIALENEFTKRNNISHAYIDIIDNKEKILIIAETPHPDIKAFRSALEKKENYEISVHIPGSNQLKEDKYDLVIFHQIPNTANIGNILLDKYLKSGTSCLFILGNQTNLNAFNSVNSLLKITSRSFNRDQVTAVFNPDFEKFTYDNSFRNTLQSLPPIATAYGDYQLKQDADVMLYQRIGSTVTKRPLLVISGDRKQAVLTGEGIWLWRLAEFKEHQESNAFDKLIESMVQYLSSKEDKRKFRCYPIQNEFMISDQILFEAETYNDIYEKIYGQTIHLKITSEGNISTSYSFVNGQNNSTFEVKGLSPGIYKYSASCVLGGKEEKVSGEFTIKEMSLESISTTANHGLLRNLSSQSGGIFYKKNEVNKLKEYLLSHKPSGVLHSEEELAEIINLPWIFILLVLLASTEWFFRKYKGGY